MKEITLSIIHQIISVTIVEYYLWRAVRKVDEHLIAQIL